MRYLAYNTLRENPKLSRLEKPFTDTGQKTPAAACYTLSAVPFAADK
jgi:hypothetical protein